jgi:hypothetical protein
MPHIALLGDSILDNGNYLAGGPDVSTQLNKLLPGKWSATLRAVDGATCADVRGQLIHLPTDASHIVVSMGGNDALLAEHLLHASVKSVAEALMVLSKAIDDFEKAYRETLQEILKTGLPTTVCTIYNANAADHQQAQVFRLAVALFNDVIIRTARTECLPVIELRSVCTEPADYANDLEPSVQGGRKIAEAILASHRLPIA